MIFYTHHPLPLILDLALQFSLRSQPSLPLRHLVSIGMLPCLWDTGGDSSITIQGMPFAGLVIGGLSLPSHLK